MNWSLLRFAPWIDTRANFVAGTPRGGRLLDLGSSDGGTLCHFAELRPDLQLASADIEGKPEAYPAGTDFKRADFDNERLPWPDGSFDRITCMHVVEHLTNPAHLIAESFRLLKPGGSIYIETPAPHTVDLESAKGEAIGRVTVNFYDDPTHVKPVPVEEVSRLSIAAGFRETSTGVSRNVLFAASYPVFRIARPHSRHRYVAQHHWTGWSVYAIATR